MILENNLVNQLKTYMEMLESPIVLSVSLGNDNVSEQMNEMLKQVAGVSSQISIEYKKLERTPSFGISKKGQEPRLFFAGIPLGHEFTSFIMALLQVSGRKPKVEDSIINKIKSIKQKMNFTTYVSLSCHNCPDVVQALNIMSAVNENIVHTMVDGAVFQKEVESKEIMAVPSVYLEDVFFNSGKQTVEEILDKIVVEDTSKIVAELNQKMYLMY